MEREVYNSIRLLSKALSKLWPRKGPLDDSTERWINDGRRLISGYRSNARAVKNMNVSHREQVRAKVRAAVGGMYISSRHSFSSAISSGPPRAYVEMARYGSGKSYTLSVGWGWYDKVYKRFYQNHLLSYNKQFIMKAERVRVNHPNVELYEVIICNLADCKLSTAWVGVAVNGNNEKACVRKSSSEAINKAISLFGRQMLTDLKKESSND